MTKLLLLAIAFILAGCAVPPTQDLHLQTPPVEYSE